MASTITTNLATTTSFATIADFKATCPSIGLQDSQIQSETTQYIVYKITNGAGTYADLYLRFANNSVQAGTGWDSVNSVLTGAGTLRPGPSLSGSHYTRSYLTSDGTVGLYQQISTTTGFVTNVWGYIKPTNTTLTASTIPLTQGIGRGTGCVGGYFNNSGANVYYTNYSSLGYAESTQRYGSLNDWQVNISNAVTWVVSFQSNYWASLPLSVAFNLQKTEAGSQGIMPNLPIFSGGRCIGYNSNLVLCSPELLPGDRIVVSQGTEEYVVIGSNGVALRQI
jgi:hypothetical protein